MAGRRVIRQGRDEPSLDVDFQSVAVIAMQFQGLSFRWTDTIFPEAMFMCSSNIEQIPIFREDFF